MPLLLLTSPGVVQLASAGPACLMQLMVVRGVTVTCETTVCMQSHKPAVFRSLCAGGGAACACHG